MYSSITIDKKRYSYIKDGSGQPLVIFPGWCDQAYNYRRLIGYLSSRYTVYALDLPNFGGSRTQEPFELDTYTKFADNFFSEMKIQDPVILGHSFGGLVSLAVAQHHHPRSVFLVNPLGCENDIGNLGFFIASVENTVGEVSEKPVEMVLSLRKWWSNFAHNCTRPDFWQFVDNITFSGYDYHRGDEDIILCWGEKDSFFSNEYRRKLADTLKTNKVYTIKGKRHSCTLNAEEYYKIITQNDLHK